jgi:hypothetical protein
MTPAMPAISTATRPVKVPDEVAPPLQPRHEWSRTANTRTLNNAT